MTEIHGMAELSEQMPEMVQSKSDAEQPELAGEAVQVAVPVQRGDNEPHSRQHSAVQERRGRIQYLGERFVKS